MGITLNIAGNSRSLSGERVTGEDFWILCRVLKNNSYINGMSPSESFLPALILLIKYSLGGISASIHLYSSGLDVRYNLLSDVGAYYAAKLLQVFYCKMFFVHFFFFQDQVKNQSFPWNVQGFSSPSLRN